MTLSARPLASAAPSPPDAVHRTASLRKVDRAGAELRRGDFVLLRPDAGPALLIQAAESVSADSLARMRTVSGQAPMLVVTMQRGAALGLVAETEGVLCLSPGAGGALDDLLVRGAADPTAHVDVAALQALARRPVPVADRDGAAAATRLAKIARLLPAVIATPIERPFATERLTSANDILSVSAWDIDHYDAQAAAGLRRVAGARVPLAMAEETEIIAFRPDDGGLEHLAIVIGHPDPTRPVLARLHSECFTGDLLGSLRCDCGDQLRGALAEIARQGGGVLLYLAQEGRGIGLINKLRAYRLQDADFDTVDANEMLGYDADERVYRPAAEMLRQLGVTQVRLLTNNPEKLAQLARHGITVTERVAHVFPANGHNEFYLATKRNRSGHLL